MEDARQVNLKILNQSIDKLKSGYNAEAFTAFSRAVENMGLLSLSEPAKNARNDLLGIKNDVLPEVDTDNKIQDLLDLFVFYYQAKKEYRLLQSEKSKFLMVKGLKDFQKRLRDIQAAIYSDTDCPEEREVLKIFTSPD